MKILSCTTLYPSSARPAHGIFVENRLRALASIGHDIRVVAPVPRFPSKNPKFGAYAQFASTPLSDQRHGLDITYPRYTVVPKIGMTAAAHALTLCFKSAIAAAFADGFVPDVIDAHYYYPDGVAAVAAAKAYELPVVVTARGTDINHIPSFERQKRMILEAAEIAASSVTVAEALRTEMIDLGADGTKITTIRNGVDLEAFSPPLQREDNPRLTIASVGHLIERKGHHFVIEAAAQLGNVDVVIAGVGPEEKKLKELAQSLGIRDRVTFLGLVPHDELKSVYGSADITVLASSREGWPNVLLESMASGTPCVATQVWGSGEVIASPQAGRLASERSSAAIASAIEELAADLPDRTETRAYAERFGWAPVAKMVERVWKDARQSGWGTPEPFIDETEKRFVVTIDTEEMFDWDGDPRDWHTPPVSVIERIQNALEPSGITPIYFVSHPLLTCPETSQFLASLVRDGRADCGLHLHTWSTPPVEEPEGWHHSYQCNIDPALHERKLDALITAFREAFGIDPLCHRAGRYGAAPWVLDQIAERGVLLDFSPSAGFNHSADGGPDFTNIGTMPRRRATSHGTQWVLPVSGARKLRRTQQFIGTENKISGLIPDTTSKATIATRLSPEGQNVGLMTSLSNFLWKTPGVILTPSVHSTSIIPGATRYSADDASANALLNTMVEWANGAIAAGAKPITLKEIEIRRKTKE